MTNTERAITFTQVYDKSYFEYNKACDIHAEQDALADMVRYQSMDRNTSLIMMNDIGQLLSTYILSTLTAWRSL